MNFAYTIKDYSKAIMKINKLKPQNKIDPNLGLDYQDAFKRGLNKKYPLNQGKNELVDKIRRNLQVGLKEKYGVLKLEPSGK